MISNTYPTRHFGPISPSDDAVFVFADGLIGLPSLRRFALIEHAPSSPFRWLQSLDEPDFALLVVEPGAFVPGYEPQVSAADAARLGIGHGDACIVYTIVTIPRGRPEAMTLNLAGPILVHAATRQARQVVLDGDEWPVQHPAFEGVARAAA
jgi:flagellar assembly factor FliW